ncbi:MAG: ribonuclease E/G [Rhodospirillales bacterium]|nr:ribonuclease E/G [Rhodospirillales bacterium]
MTRLIRASASPGEVRIAVTEPALRDYALWRPGAPDGLDDIHRGRVQARVPAMAGSFVVLAGGAQGFLPDSAATSPPVEGQMLLLRVTRAPQGGKGVRLSGDLGDDADPAWRAEGPPALLRPGPGPLLRLAMRHPDAPVLVDDAGLAARLQATLGARVERVAHAFDEATETAVDALAEPVLSLPGGARISITPTPALTAIDVDAGAESAAAGAKGRMQRALNRAVLPVLAAQIRLRNLGGAILIDPAGLSLAARRALLAPLAALLADDPARPRLIGLSGLGLIEILRPRGSAPLHDLLIGPHAAGLAGLRTLARAIAAAPATPAILRAAPAVVAALQRDAVALEEMAALAGQRIALRADPALPAHGWRLEAGHG